MSNATDINDIIDRLEHNPSQKLRDEIIIKIIQTLSTTNNSIISEIEKIDESTTNINDEYTKYVNLHLKDIIVETKQNLIKKIKDSIKSDNKLLIFKKVIDQIKTFNDQIKKKYNNNTINISITTPNIEFLKQHKFDNYNNILKGGILIGIIKLKKNDKGEYDNITTINKDNNNNKDQDEYLIDTANHEYALIGMEPNGTFYSGKDAYSISSIDNNGKISFTWEQLTFPTIPKFFGGKSKSKKSKSRKTRKSRK